MLFKALHNTKGVVDLFSVMVGVVITSILAGIAVASLIVVVPSVQDNTAKQNLSSLRTAQENYFAVNGVYGDGIALSGGSNGTGPKYIQPQTSPFTVVPNTGSSCYTASVASASGKIFYISSDTTTEATTTVPAACTPKQVAVASSASKKPFYTGRMAVAGSTRVVIDGNGKTWAWGNNALGQVGMGTTTTASYPAPTAVLMPSGVSNFTKVAAGGNQFYGIGNDGKLYGWGNNTNQVLAPDAVAAKPTPALVQSATLNAYVFRTMSVTGNNGAAITRDGDLWIWGLNTSGQLGDGTATASTVPKKLVVTTSATTNDQIKFRDVYMSQTFGVAIDTLDRMWIWGINSYGQLGNGTAASATAINKPTLVPGTTRWKTAAVLSGSVAAISTTDKLFTWGENDKGQLGRNNTTNLLSPSELVVANITTWFDVTGNSNPSTNTASGNGLATATTNKFFVALSGTGTTADFSQRVYAWGSNDQGQINNGSATGQILVPTTTAAATKYTNIFATPDGAYALDATAANSTTEAFRAAKLFAWGNLSNNTTATATPGTGVKQTTPTQVQVPATY